MASTHQIVLDNQTNDDFFDKVVADTYSPREAHAFMNLSVVGDSVGDGDEEINEADSGNVVVANEGPTSSMGNGKVSSIALEAVQFGLKSEMDDISLFETAKESATINGAGRPGVKEVDWGSFYVASSVNDGSGFGSSSDFFTEFEGSTDHLQGKAEVEVANAVNLVSNDTNNTIVGVDNSAGFEQRQGEMDQKFASEQCDVSTGQLYQVDGHDKSMDSQERNISSTSNWETVASTDNSDVGYLRQGITPAVADTTESVSMHNQVSQMGNGYPEHMIFDAQYPGWYYDTISQEWRSLDSYKHASQTTGQANDQEVQSSNALTTMYHSNGIHAVYDKRQTLRTHEFDIRSQHGSLDQSYYANNQQGTETWPSEKSSKSEAAESMSTWKQVSLVGNGYPEHMVFDAQFPEWYYDKIAQEWRSLDSYNQASRTTVTAQAHDQQFQNGHALTASYHIDRENNMYNVNDKKQTFQAQEFGIQSQHENWDQSYYINNQQATNTWQSEYTGKAEAAVNSSSLTNFGGSQQVYNLYSTESVDEQFKPNKIGVQSFIPQQTNVATVIENGPLSFSNDFYNRQKSVDDAQQSFQSNQLFSPSAGRSSDGRPPHALINFGFGGKLIVMKDNTGSFQNLSFGSQVTGGNSISVLNLAEVISGSASYSSLGEDSSSYFRCLHQQALPGPLVGGNVGSKDLHKWLDERILHCESFNMDFSRGKLLKLLLSLLRISCQYYGKLRSPFGMDAMQKETDSAEAAVAKLFAFAKQDAVQNDGFAPFSQCLQHLPPESQMQVTASEVQNLLVSGKKMQALQCAQEGHLWGLALVIASQLGAQFYADTVKQMALRQLVPGSPLRTLCLLVAGQPAEVFSSGSTSDVSSPASVSVPQHQPQFGNSSILDNWEENLGIITANRTKDDELVLTHLGDCMWKERGEIILAHICYLIADKNFDPYSDISRLCLVGADHLNNPRTYASPEAIQRTELYEYSKTLGNSQYILLPFQPYKVIYAHMLAEVGKLSAAQKYCSAVLKCLKTGRTPQAEMWKQLVLSLDDRIRIHQQGGYTVNFTPANLVTNLLRRVIGGMPPPAVHSTTLNQQANELQYSQSAKTMQSLMSPTSMEPIHDWDGNGRVAAYSKSALEPDFGMTPIQDQTDLSKDKAADGGTQLKSNESGKISRLSRFGIGILKNTVGKVFQARPSKEAKLGAENQFYFDKELNRWVERGGEPPAEEAALPPPPTFSSFQNNSLGYENKSEMKNEMHPSNRSWSNGSPTPSDNSSGIPPISQGSNQLPARGRMGVRSRYVDTFNQGRGNSQTMFQSPPIQPPKPPIPAKANFFIPTAPASSSNDHVSESHVTETRQEEEYSATTSTSDPPPPPPQQNHSSFQSATPSQTTIQRFQSLDNNKRSESSINLNGGDDFPSSGSRRTASRNGSLKNSFTSATGPSKFRPIPLNNSTNSSSVGEELQEVEL